MVGNVLWKCLERYVEDRLSGLTALGVIWKGASSSSKFQSPERKIAAEVEEGQGGDGGKEAEFFGGGPLRREVEVARNKLEARANEDN